MSGPPPFTPPAPLLSSHVEKIQAALSEYKSATTDNSKAQALAKISSASGELNNASTSSPAQLQQLNFRSVGCAAVRVAVQMGLFEALPKEGSASVEDLAAKCNAEPEFTLRIARAVASQGILRETAQGEYAATPVSMVLCNETPKAALSHMMDNVAVTMFHLYDYFEKHGYRSPEDHRNTPAVFARGLKDIDYFEWMTQEPKHYANFNKAMAFQNIMGSKEIARTYAFDQLPPGNSGVAIVDVGGGKGHVLNEIISVHPNIAGHAVLEDLENVINPDTVVQKEQVQTQIYNFIEQQQPVKGASAYFMRHILHDWPDSACRTILQNHVEAMRGHDSRLLLSELVLPDAGGGAHKILRDINMMQLAGKERSEKQWHTLLDGAGFRIVKIHGKDNATNSIIEAVLKD